PSNSHKLARIRYWVWCHALDPLSDARASAGQEFSQLIQQRGAVPRLALPNDQRRPAGGGERAERRSVAGAIAFDLRAPVACIVLRRSRPALAIVAVPETAVHEDGFAKRAEDEV